jgi:hypothetical protein
VSFFDEVDEQPPTTPRTQPRRSRSSGGGRRPPGGQQSIQTRRVVAAVVLLVVVILVALGVHSCQVSQRNSALKSYSNDVSSVITDSNNTGTQLFKILSSGVSSASGTSVYNSITQTLSQARKQLATARGFSVPDQVKVANQNLLLALQMRVDALTNIAKQIQPALGNSASKDAVYAIAAEIARLYSSDVVYKDYTTKEIAAALHGAGIAVGSPNGQSIAGGQFVPDVSWVTPTFLANELHVTLPQSSNNGNGKFVPGLHGHILNSVSVAGTTLQTGSPNPIAASPAPKFTLSFTNGGHFNEFNVVCKVTISGTSDGGQTTVPETFAGKSATCTVPLKSVPSTGTATVVATIEPVQGETNIADNTLSYPVTFQ